MFSFMTSAIKKNKAKGATPVENQGTSSLGQSTSTANEASGSESVKDTPVKVGWLRSHRRSFSYGSFYENLVLYLFLNVQIEESEKRGTRGRVKMSFRVSKLIGTEPVHSEGDQTWDFFGRNDAEAETPVLWPPHAKS